MKRVIAYLSVLLVLLATTIEVDARGRGGGGFSRGGGGISRGGGGFSRGGGGISRGGSRSFSRPSTPSFSRPSSRPSISRPSTSRPSISRPSTSRPSISRPSTRPGLQPGNRPSLQPGNRPSIGSGNRPTIKPQPGTRPSLRPGGSERPALGGGNRPSQLPSTRPGIGNRPTIGDRPGIGNRPGISNRPGTGAVLPGLGVGAGIGAGLANRERPSLNDRRSNLQDRLDNRGDRIANRDDRLDNRGDRFDNRQDRWQDRRDNWQGWHDRHYPHHGHWHHGYWAGHWGPGARWDYWWDNYPVMSAFGLTTWAINRVGWAFGYNDYANPYYGGTTVVDNSVYNYSQPIVMTPDEQTLAADPTDTSPPPGVSTAAMSDFDKAQQQFYEGDYNAALASTDAAIKQMPNDTVIHEFRALVLFALGKYQDAAATLYAVLSVGPGWDWTTMSSLYPDVAAYTEQLRKLETFCRENPNDPAGLFVLAYEYITCGHNDAAVAQLKALVEVSPKDQLAANLLQQLDPEAKMPTQPEITKPPEAVAKVDAKQLVGTWQAKRPSGETFEMTLDDKGAFDWKFAADGKTQEVKGAYAIQDSGELAMEMNDEGVMLAQLDVKGDNMDFYMLGDTLGSPPLKFTRQ